MLKRHVWYSGLCVWCLTVCAFAGPQGSVREVPPGTEYFTGKALAQAAQDRPLWFLENYKWPSRQDIAGHMVASDERGVHNAWAAVAGLGTRDEEREWLASARTALKAVAGWQSDLYGADTLSAIIKQGGAEEAVTWMDKAKRPVLDSLNRLGTASCPASLAAQRERVVQAANGGMAVADVAEETWRAALTSATGSPPDREAIRKEITQRLRLKYGRHVNMALPYVLFQCEDWIRWALQPRWIPDDLPKRLVPLRRGLLWQLPSGSLSVDVVRCQYMVGDWAIHIYQHSGGIGFVVRRMTAGPTAPSADLARQVMAMFLPLAEGTEPTPEGNVQRLGALLRGEVLLTKVRGPKDSAIRYRLTTTWTTDGQAVAVSSGKDLAQAQILKAVPDWFDVGYPWSAPSVP